MLHFLSSIRIAAARCIAPSAAALVDADDTPIADLEAGACEIIAGRQHIAQVMRRMAVTRQPVVLSGRLRPGGRTTRIVGVEAEEILIRQVANDSDHTALIEGGPVNLYARHLGQPILCTLEGARACRCGGTACYRAPLPRWLLHAQMRDSLRVSLPKDLHAVLAHTFADNVHLEARVIDLSEGGLGLILPKPPPRPLTVGEPWAHASLRSRDGELCTLQLQLRHIGTTAAGMQRLGAAIRQPTEVQRQLLRRLILRHSPLTPKTE